VSNRLSHSRQDKMRPMDVQKALAGLQEILDRFPGLYEIVYERAYESGQGVHLNINRGTHSDPVGDVIEDKTEVRDQLRPLVTDFYEAVQKFDRVDSTLASLAGLPKGYFKRQGRRRRPWGQAG
jgi:hypothetical protein